VTAAAPLVIRRCVSCHGRFLPRPGLCPRCGSRSIAPYEIAPRGRVLAATELSAPAPGWPAPHRLALLEAEDGVRLLAHVPGPLPPLGSTVAIAQEGERFVVLATEPDG
jgi:uncharacterized OB-fold protein